VTMPACPTLAIDLGGSKIAAALVQGGTILERRQAETPRWNGADAWIDAVLRLTEGWSGFERAGIAVTGLVRDGRWRSLNPATLPVPDDFPLVDLLGRRLGLPVVAGNDAQAAAWGEYRFGAGQGQDLVFLTISTGIGGGIVLGGRLRTGRSGLAGHAGITPIQTAAGIAMLEDVASGNALARRFADQGGAPAVAQAAQAGEAWAVAATDDIVVPVALALRRLQLILDPDLILIGGGLGLAPGYLHRLSVHLEQAPPLLRPTIRAAALGADAGLIGIADLAEARTAPEGPA
jgi:N-acetylmannosamine-6-phosphate 2-epimerase/N-acetylmannosamine kinase